MSAICGACNLSLVRDGSEVKCDGQCDRYFHADCVKEDVASKKTRSAWRCKDCRASSHSSAKSTSTSATSITKEFLKHVLEEFKKEVFEELKTFRKDLGDFRGTAEFLSSAIETSNAFMKDMKHEFAELKKQNSELLAANRTLSGEVGELRDRVRTLEQYTRRCNVEISGIPVTRGEDVLKIVRDVGGALGLPTKEEDVAAAHRVPSFRRDTIPSIVVQFERRNTRDSWINTFKSKKTLMASEVTSFFPNTARVWVNEHLSPENKIFLSKLKKKCRDISFKYAWCREGKFYVRKADGERFQRILTDTDIEKLK